jgi:hypothetical protein
MTMRSSMQAMIRIALQQSLHFKISANAYDMLRQLGKLGQRP